MGRRVLYDLSYRKAEPVEALWFPQNFDEVASFLKPLPKSTVRAARFNLYAPGVLSILDSSTTIHGDEHHGTVVEPDRGVESWRALTDGLGSRLLYGYFQIPNPGIPEIQGFRVQSTLGFASLNGPDNLLWGMRCWQRWLREDPQVRVFRRNDRTAEVDVHTGRTLREMK